MNLGWSRGLIATLVTLFLILSISSLLYESFKTIKVFHSITESTTVKNAHATPSITKDSPILHWQMGRDLSANAAPASETKWILRGIILGDTDDKNEAIISSPTTNEAVYQSGSKLSDGAILFKILPDQVVLKINNTTEILSIQWNSEEKSPAPLFKNLPLNYGKAFTTMREP